MKSFWCTFVVLFMASAAFSLMTVEEGGKWPKNWPEELEPLRKNSTTGDFSAGSQAIYYFIEFDSRKQFENIWPSLLRLKSKGAPLSLMTVDPPKTDPNDRRVLYSEPTAVIVCPTQAEYSRMPDGSYTHRAEWTEDIESQLTNGVLPQFVGKDKTGKWSIITNPRDPNSMYRYGFLQQARIEIWLYVDGDVIDISRIPLPKDTPIRDHRKLNKKNERDQQDE